MDSLTQIVLGAAVGEITLGKKVGNRALLWGAVGGTIPDLDVIAGAFLTPLQELAFHRGFSHSITFAVVGAFVFGWLIHRIYQSPYHKYLAVVGWLLIPIGVLYFLKRIFERELGWVTFIIMTVILLAAIYFLARKYFKDDYPLPEANLRDWQWLMFWTIFTHPLLDCFTTYGTQLFQPFSDYRVAFNVISVADPLYTIPFLICVIALSFYHRHRPLRRKLAWAGIAISSVYMAFCIFNKQRINTIWKNTLVDNNIEYTRYMSSPTIFNNILWTCLAETEGGYVTGQYSFFDSEPKVDYRFIPRLPEGLESTPDHRTFDCMRWFSNNYYNILRTSDGYQFNDLRFGTVDLGGKEHYIFNFPIIESAPGDYKMLGTNGGPPPGSEEEMMGKLVERIKGE